MYVVTFKYANFTEQFPNIRLFHLIQPILFSHTLIILLSRMSLEKIIALGQEKKKPVLRAKRFQKAVGRSAQFFF